MKTKIKAVSKTGKGVLLEGQEGWINFINAIVDEQPDIEQFRTSLIGAEIEYELIGNMISKFEIIKKPEHKQENKDDYWLKKFEYERDVRDVHLKAKGELDQAIEVVKLAYENKMPIDEMVKCVEEAKKLLFKNE